MFGRTQAKLPVISAARAAVLTVSSIPFAKGLSVGNGGKRSAFETREESSKAATRMKLFLELSNILVGPTVRQDLKATPVV